MKIFAILLLVLFAVLAIEAGPAKKKVESKCDLICTADYTPICGGVPNDKTVKPKLFGNACVMKRHNCEHNTNLVAVDVDQCKNSDPQDISAFIFMSLFAFIIYILNSFDNGLGKDQ